MDFVYILGSGSNWLDNELRYSLRSLKNVKDKIGKIWVVGKDSGFLKDVEHVPFPDDFKNKNQNALAKILFVCNEEPFLSEDFVLMNDDFYFLKPQPIKNRARKSLKETLTDYRKRNINSKYVAAMENTVAYLENNNLPLVDYEVHYPLIINKEAFKKVFENIDWKANPLLFRSVYGNSVKLKTTRIKEDCKAYNDDDLKRMQNKHFI